MARPLRIRFQGAWYHVMNRGAARREVFPASEDVADFLMLLGELVAQFLVEVHGYCVMGNHYHVLLRTPQVNLDRAMRHLDGVYAQRFHRRHGTDGPLFRGRYLAVLVQADRHLVHVSRYIHLNPVEAGLASRAEDWPHSSLRGYVDPARGPRWLRTSAVLGHFGSIGARQRYRQFVAAGIDPGTRDFYGRSRLRPVLGEDDFREEILRRAAALPPDAEREVPDQRLLAGPPVPLATVASAIGEAWGIGAPALHRGSSAAGRSVGTARGAFVHAARRLGGHRLREIAAWLGYRSYTSVAKAAMRFRQAADESPDLRLRLAAVIEALEAPRKRTHTHSPGATAQPTGNVKT